MGGVGAKFRWRVAAAGALSALGVWACLNPETDDFPTYDVSAGGSGATAVDPNNGGSTFSGEGAAGGDGAAGSSVHGSAGGGAGGPSRPQDMGNGPDAGAPDAGSGDAGSSDAGSLVSDGD